MTTRFPRSRVYSASTDDKDATLVLDTSAYADGDVLVVPQEITEVFEQAGQAKALHSIVLLDEDDQGQALDLLFFNADAALGTINEAVSISNADARNIIGAVEIATSEYIDLVNSQMVQKSALGMVLKAASTSRSLWIAAISRGTGTYTASGIRLKLGFL